MDENLRRVAREGNVSDFYKLIKRDGNALRRIDEVEFIETPLHIAAEAGCIDFAMEIMSLKPSFGRKLNHEGLSPIHLAVEKGHKELVLYLMENAKDLVRVKGKKGETPLHYVITREENSEILLLPRFLEDCPDSIRDLTVENQTALHIAVRNNKEEVLKILCKMLSNTNYCRDVVNQKDRNGDTALHIAARNNQHEMIKLLLKTKADNHAVNEAGSTALDVAQQYNNNESITTLRGFYIPGVSPFIYKLQKKIANYVKKTSSLIFHDMDNISMEDRNALLVVLGLLLTATYQASLSPPSGVWQDDNEGHIAGESVMDDLSFLLFYIPASAVFIVTFFLMLGLLKPFPRGFRTALQVLLSFLAMSFYQSISFLTPTWLALIVIDLLSFLLFVLMMFMSFAYRVSKVSVLILGCWLYPRVFDPLNQYHDLDKPFVGFFIGNSIVGCLLFLFLYDEFLKGTILVIGYALLIGLGYIRYWDGFHAENIPVIYPIIIVPGCWLFLGLCRFCIKGCIQLAHCNAYTALRDQWSLQLLLVQLVELWLSIRRCLASYTT